MASSLIHICVAKEINKYLKRDEKQLLIGSIAPDIAKLISQSKDTTHFIENEKNIPNLNIFLNKYKKQLNDDFVMGYYIHLYTDYVWFKFFIPNFLEDNNILKLNNKIEKYNEEKFNQYIYNDYHILNKKLIDDYELNLKIFYEEPPKIKNIIKEMPIEKIQIIIDKAGILLTESINKKEKIFNEELIHKFVEFCTQGFLSNIDEK